MTDHSTAIVAPLARWSCRIALFSVSLLLVGLVLHRATSFSTAVAINLFFVGYAGAAVAMLVGAVALVQIWRTGFGGAGSVAVGDSAAAAGVRPAGRLLPSPTTICRTSTT